MLFSIFKQDSIILVSEFFLLKMDKLFSSFILLIKFSSFLSIMKLSCIILIISKDWANVISSLVIGLIDFGSKIFWTDTKLYLIKFSYSNFSDPYRVTKILLISWKLKWLQLHFGIEESKLNSCSSFLLWISSLLNKCLKNLAEEYSNKSIGIFTNGVTICLQTLQYP